MRAPDPPEDQEQSFVSHLIELRARLLPAVLCVVVVLFALFAFRNTIYSALAKPLMRHLPEGATMIATEVTSTFTAPFKLTVFVAIAVSVPYILYQLWAFVAPGLYRHERRLILPLLVSSTGLFYLGIAFAYFLVFPVVFGFFSAVAPEGVTMMTDINKYLDFVLTLFLAFGVVFEVPVAVVLMVRFGVMTAEQLKSKRPYVIVGSFVVAAFITPPDVLSQFMLAMPMWFLYELGLLCARTLEPKSASNEEAGEKEPG